MNSDTQPFLSKEGVCLDCGDGNDGISEVSIIQPKKPLRLAVAIHALILTIYTTIFLFTIINNSLKPLSIPHGMLPGLKLEYRKHVQSFEDATYSGPPSSEVDRNWGNLMSTMRIRVSDQELAELDQTSVPLAETENIAWLGVYHQLHCVQLLRQYVYFDHYFPPNVSDDDMYHLRSHADHCLEVLRQGAMCASDTSLTTLSWEPGKRHPSVDLNGRPKQFCANWDLLLYSVKDRVVGEEEYDALINPLV